MNREQILEATSAILLLADTLDVNQYDLTRAVMLTVARKSYADYDSVRRHLRLAEEGKL